MPSRSLPPSARRPELLSELIAALTEGDADTPGLVLHDRGLGDPTVALLDAWATVGDVIGFYLDRIAEEGYVATARESGSLLALAGMLGHRPRPGIAATLHLAYTLQADPDDKAVLLPRGLLSQSVPGPGEQPQTFETATPLLTRPSWNTLAVKRTAPLTLPQAGPDALRQFVVAGTAHRLSANDAILLSLSGSEDPAVVRVASAIEDAKARQTTVSLQAEEAKSAESDSSEVQNTIDALERLTPALSRQPSPPPASATALRRSPDVVFASGSDVVPRLLAALKPELAPTLYGALGSVPIGTQAVTAAAVLRVKAAPFGAQAPPRQLLDDRGQPVGSEELPIEQVHALEFRLSIASLVALAGRMERSFGPALRAQQEQLSARAGAERGRAPFVEVICESPLGERRRNVALDAHPPWSADLDPLGKAEMSTTAGALEVSYTSSDAKRLPELTLTATLDSTQEGVVLELGDQQFMWDPGIRSPIHASFGDRRLTIAWPAALGTTGPAALSVRIETPLAVANPRRLTLDARYDTIVAGTHVVIDRVQDAAGTTSSQYPVVAEVISASPVVVTRYGMTAKASELELSKPWIGEQERLLSAARVLTVRAQPDALSLEPVPVDAEVGGEVIELDRLVAGMEPGHLIAVTGTRADLPPGASVTGGEVAMVANVIQAAAADGEQPHTTLQLAHKLAYRYVRSTVSIYGNVVAAHQGATTHEVLGGGNPSETHQTFTLATAPLLADAAETRTGRRSTLSVTVDGVAADEVARIYRDTPRRSYVTGLDPAGHTTITFAGPLPPGNGNVRASYRAGDGSLGNVRPGQITQLLSRPLGVTGVTNPLSGSGGVAPDGPAQVRDTLPAGLRSLGRLVSVADYADFARSWATVGKTTARVGSEAGREVILVTVGGDQPVMVDEAVCSSIADAARGEGDPEIAVRVLPADLLTIVLVADVTRDPQYDWDTVARGVRSALTSDLGYRNRALGQAVVLSEIVAAAHRVPGVLAFAPTQLALVPQSATAGGLAGQLPRMLTSRAALPPVIDLASALADWGEAPATVGPAPEAIAYLDPSLPDTLMLTEVSA